MAVSVSRRITMTRPLEEALFQHFIHQKLEIAYAINKPTVIHKALSLRRPHAIFKIMVSPLKKPCGWTW
uniref:SP110 nuclear body protein variant 13 n=1 Tax=Sus scrofa TaxID=9823 RepID=S5A7U5_PIG|nr:SP110 nuclear body protein variant 13 [Sus scrofa]